MYPTHLPTFLNTLSHMLHLDCIHACMLVLPPPPHGARGSSPVRKVYSDFNTVFMPLLLLAAGVGFPAACF